MQATKLHPFVGTILLCVHGTFYYLFIHSSIDGHLGWLCHSYCGQCCSARVNVSWVIRPSADCIVRLFWVFPLVSKDSFLVGWMVCCYFTLFCWFFPHSYEDLLCCAVDLVKFVLSCLCVGEHVWRKAKVFFFSFKISSSSSIVGNLGLGGRFWVDCCIWWEKRAWGWRLCLWIVSFPSAIIEMDFPFQGACSWHFCIKPGSCRHVFSGLWSATLTYVYICMLGYWELGLSQGGLVTRKIWLAWKVDLPPGPEEVGVHLITSGQWLRQLSLIIRAS